MSWRRNSRRAGSIRRVVWYVGWLLTSAVLTASPTNVVLHLKNGDRLAGVIVMEDVERVVLNTSWADSVSVPLNAIERREVVWPKAEKLKNGKAEKAAHQTGAASEAAPPGQPVVADTNAVAKAEASPLPAKNETIKPAPKKFWKADIRLGLDYQTGAKERSLYFGKVRLTYEQPYEQNPKKFFRSIADYSADYGETDGERSVNRMYGSLKTDWDLSERWYIYNQAGAGYDEFRRIDLAYEIGPGLGYHVFTRPKFVLDVEGGVTYRYENRSTSADTETFYGRIAESLTWKLSPRITFTEKLEFFPSLEQGREFRLRFEANLSFGLTQNLTFNLSVLDTYDTAPARSVERNELLIRSALGVKF